MISQSTKTHRGRESFTTNCPVLNQALHKNIIYYCAHISPIPEDKPENYSLETGTSCAFNTIIYFDITIIHCKKQYTHCLYKKPFRGVFIARQLFFVHHIGLILTIYVELSWWAGGQQWHCVAHYNHFLLHYRLLHSWGSPICLHLTLMEMHIKIYIGLHR